MHNPSLYFLQILRHLQIVIICVIILMPASLHGQSYLTEEGYIEFTSSVPLHSFRGSSNQLNGLIDLGENLVDFSIDLQTLDTGNGKRDRNMYSALNVEEYPIAEFTGSITCTFNQQSAEEQKVTVMGDFSIHGITQTIEVNGTLQHAEIGLQLNTSWILNLNDYDIEPPGFLFYKVDEEVEIQIKAVLNSR